MIDTKTLRLQAAEGCRSIFRPFRSGGGSIDSSELADVMKSLGQEPSPEELEKLIKLADGDGSGDIDFLEVRK